MKESPIFVIGSPRSGTTLLRLMLTCHRNIVIPPECGFAAWLADRFTDWNAQTIDQCLTRFVGELFECRKIETWNLDKEQLITFLESHHPECYSHAVSLVYQFYANSINQRCTRWGDKNNFYVDYISTLNKLFPAAEFVHIIRDGRDIASSYKRLKHVESKSPYFPTLPADIEQVAQQWQRDLETVGIAFDRIGRDSVVEIHYEELVLDPKSTLRNICDSIGEDFDDTMLGYHDVNRQQILEPAEFLAWKEKTTKPPTASQIGCYQTDLTSEEIAAFESVAGGMLKDLAYTT